MTHYIYGEDPASQNDYFGIVIHELQTPTRDNPKPLPFLKDIYKLNNTSFDRIIEFHTQTLFKKFPPSYIAIDYTNERTFTDIMEKRFGKSRIKKVTFSAGTSGTKKMLKDDGLSILKQGYQFPNPYKIKDPDKGQLVRDLIEQLKHEEMKITPSGKESFDHPTGRHNDLAIAWELSIHGCIQLGLRIDMPGVRIGGGTNPKNSSLIDDYSTINKLGFSTYQD